MLVFYAEYLGNINPTFIPVKNHEEVLEYVKNDVIQRINRDNSICLYGLRATPNLISSLRLDFKFRTIMVIEVEKYTVPIDVERYSDVIILRTEHGMDMIIRRNVNDVTLRGLCNLLISFVATML